MPEALNTALYEIRQVLLNHWDPFHVHHTNGDEHDYDNFLPKLHRYLVEHKTADKIAEYLLRAETEVFGLRGSTLKDFEVISKKLLEIPV
jgi:hypothetical protein